MLTDILVQQGGTEISVQKLTDIRPKRESGGRHLSSNVDRHLLQQGGRKMPVHKLTDIRLKGGETSQFKC